MQPRSSDRLNGAAGLQTRDDDCSSDVRGRIPRRPMVGSGDATDCFESGGGPARVRLDPLAARVGEELRFEVIDAFSRDGQLRVVLAGHKTFTSEVPQRELEMFT